jgi:hypothetical protein
LWEKFEELREPREEIKSKISLIKKEKITCKIK